MLSIYQTAKYVKASYNAVVDVFECIETFLSRLEIYTEVQPTPVMMEIVVKIMVELLAVLALATKQINQGRFSRSSCLCIILSSTNWWIRSLQRNMQEGYLERKILNPFFSGSIDSPSRSQR